MRLLIDAHMVGERETGNETVIVNLLRGMARVATDDEVFVAATHPEALARLVPARPNFTVVPVSTGPIRRLGWDLPRLARRLKVDVLCVTYIGPPFVSCPVVVLVHDVSFTRHPEWFSPRDRLVLNLGVGWTARRSAAVITVSEFSKREIASVLRVPARRVRVALGAAAPEFGPTEREDAGIRDRHGLRSPYVLAVGNLQPRKNLERLVEAFARVVARQGIVHDLAIVGRATWRGSSVGRLIEELAPSGRVKLVGYVGADDLPAIYRGADVFAYPSLYEGFGLPVLEAMACGTPVVTSNVSAMPEVVGDAARLVNPESVEEIAAGLAELCVDQQHRATLRERGLARSGMFTWDRAAKQALETLRRAASGQRE